MPTPPDLLILDARASANQYIEAARATHTLASLIASSCGWARSLLRERLIRAAERQATAEADLDCDLAELRNAGLGAEADAIEGEVSRRTGAGAQAVAV